MKTVLIIVLTTINFYNSYSQSFINGTFNGSAGSFPPGSWLNVPFTDVHSNASGFMEATTDVVDAVNSSGFGLGINAFNGTTCVSGLNAMFDSLNFWHEGLMQTVNGFTVGTSYTIYFRQTVQKQSNALDTSGAWSFFLDDTPIGISTISSSLLAPNSFNLVWDLRSITFTATQSTHTIKFLCTDDDLDNIISSTNENGALRMALDSIHLALSPPTIDLGNDTTLCEGQSLVLNPQLSSANFVWQDGSTNPTFTVTSPGTYWCNALIGGVIVDQDTIHVSYISSSTVDLGPDIFICDNNSINEVLNAGIGTSYLWSTGENTQTIQVNLVGTYSVEVTIGTCVFTDDISIEQVDLALLDNLIVSDTIGCAPLSVNFTSGIDLSNPAISSINWNFGDGFNSTSSNNTHSFLDAGNYSINFTINSTTGCSVDTLINITVLPSPTASFNYTLSSTDYSVYFNNLSTNYSSLDWHFSDNYSTSQVNPSHTFGSAGNYQVVLVCTNQFNCIDSVVQLITIKDQTSIYAPNAFTPNSDEFNNVWKISAYGFELTGSSYLIYNRWGELIFESNDISVPWDGTYNGKLVENGEYTWVLTLKTDGESPKELLTGKVNLIR